MALLVPVLIGLLSIILPGFFLALALLRKTGISLFEILAIGFIFGLTFPPTLVWLESYLITYVHFFSFSADLYNLNVAFLTVMGIILCVWQGVFNFGSFSGLPKKDENVEKAIETDYKNRIKNLRSTISNLSINTELMKRHEREEEELIRRHKDELDMLSNVGEEERKKINEAHRQQEKKLYEAHESEERILLNRSNAPDGGFTIKPIWVMLLALMLLSFFTRIANITVAPKYFEFDPYFDMISTEYIIVHGYQLNLDHSAWPTVVNGTGHRLEPLVPYLEAYWYQISATPQPSNALHLASANKSDVFAPQSNSINIALMSVVTSVYPPIAAALLVFVVFMFLYHEYGEMPAIFGAILAAAMPALITTFIAGEQLVEPWGIMAMFFFYASYLLAVNNPEEKRFAILAGLAFASNFLGAHYYTVPTAILAAYILLQGIVNILRKQESRDFFIMNAMVLAIIVLFYLPYGPYNSSLTNRVPLVAGIPIIIAMPLFALLFIFVSEFLIKYLEKQGMIKEKSSSGLEVQAYKIIVIVLLVLVAMVPILFTPLGKPFQKYIQLSIHFTTPSIPLFMTVQEYAPTGFNYDFGRAGFGLIGNDIAGVAIIVWSVLIAFTAIEILAIYKRNSKSSILAVAAVLPLAVAGFSEVKYLPHFGVGYIIAICAIIGELFIILGIRDTEKHMLLLYGFTAALIVLSAVVGLFEAPLLISALIVGAAGVAIAVLGFFFYLANQASDSAFIIIYFVMLLLIGFELVPSVVMVVQATANPSCGSINHLGNSIGANMFCNQVPQYWLVASAWMRNNVGPYGARIMSWWDYGDWINWFGNSNAALRGDNAVATYDYATAARFVLGPQDGYDPANLASFMDSSQARYVLFDDQLVPKWGALDFLGCVHANQTSRDFAIKQGQQYNLPFQLGASNCETRHDPLYLLLPISPGISDYCQFSNATNIAIRGVGAIGNSAANVTYCIPQDFFNAFKPAQLLSSNGTKTNAYLIPDFFGGTTPINGQQYASFLVIYSANALTGNVTNAPSQFYNSNFYKGFFLGRLKGFSLAYPSNFTGLNYVNSTHKVVILKLNNFSGQLPPVTPKPSWIANNYSMPG